MDKETDRILMTLKNSTRTIKTALWISSPAVLLLYTFMKRMVKHKMIKTGEFAKIEKFLKYTDGKYNIQNIPLLKDSEKHLSEIKEELERLNIKFSVLPDLNKDDGFVQIAVATEDRELFQGWQERYVFKQMQGGEKELDYLQKITNRQTSIINIPFEDKLDIVKEDFKNLGINYAVLPDLKVADEKIQLTVANEDLGKVEHWYKLYQENMLKADTIEPLEVITDEQYLAQGVITEQEYIDKAPSNVQDINNQYLKEAGVLEKAVMEKELLPKSITDPNYNRFLNDPTYHMVTIDRETLINQSRFGGDKELIQKGYFPSRVPGTWGEEELTLLTHTDQVFKQDNNYVAFVEKDKKPFIFDNNKKPIPRSRIGSGVELLKSYDTEIGAMDKTKEILVRAAIPTSDISLATPMKR